MILDVYDHNRETGRADQRILRFSHKNTNFSRLYMETGFTGICSECSDYCSVRQYYNILLVHV